jgi:hypothetical protein
MKIAGHEIDTKPAEAYMAKEWGAGRRVAPCDVQFVLLSAVPDSADKHWIVAEAQRRLCQRYRKRGVCRYDREYGWWVAA